MQGKECQRCGFQNTLDSVICSNCGKSISTTPATVNPWKMLLILEPPFLFILLLFYSQYPYKSFDDVDGKIEGLIIVGSLLISVSASIYIGTVMYNRVVINKLSIKGAIYKYLGRNVILVILSFVFMLLGKGIAQEHGHYVFTEFRGLLIILIPLIMTGISAFAISTLWSNIKQFRKRDN